MVRLFYVYIIENSLNSGWYIGFSTDVERRLEEHNTKIGSSHTRKAKGDWKLIYLEGYIDKRDALGREKYLKSGSGRKYIKKQLVHYIENNMLR